MRRRARAAAVPGARSSRNNTTRSKTRSRVVQSSRRHSSFSQEGRIGPRPRGPLRTLPEMSSLISRHAPGAFEVAARQIAPAMLPRANPRTRPPARGVKRPFGPRPSGNTTPLGPSRSMLRTCFVQVRELERGRTTICGPFFFKAARVVDAKGATTTQSLWEKSSHKKDPFTPPGDCILPGCLRSSFGLGLCSASGRGPWRFSRGHTFPLGGGRRLPS